MNSDSANLTWSGLALISLVVLGLAVGLVVGFIFLVVAIFRHNKPRPERSRRGRPVMATPVAAPAERSGPGYRLLVGLWILGLIAAAVLAAMYAHFRSKGYISNHKEEIPPVLASMIVLSLAALTVVRFVWINWKGWVAAVTYAHPVPGQDHPAPPSVAATRPRLWLAWAAILFGLVICALWIIRSAGNGEVWGPGDNPAVWSRLLIGGMVAVVTGVGVVLLRGVFRRIELISRPAKRALAGGVPVAIVIVGIAMVSEGVSLVSPALTILASVFLAAGCRTVLSRWAYPEWWAHRRRLLRPETVPAVSPLPVAPLILTPDPTPAGGACPTCGSPIPAGSPQGLCPRCLMREMMQSANATRARPVRPIDPPPPAEVNEFFPHLEVLELIGAGGMGAVYKARQPNLDRVVALKIVQSPTGHDDPVFAERFAREARAMARLDHPNIVTIYESGQAGGLPFMLMEFVDGITLRDAMENKVLTTGEALAVIPQICDALDYAHRTGVVHRDIKPENILIDQTGRVKIADFGLAKLADPMNVTLTRTQQAMGTPHYMAPEQWEKPNEVDHRADIYALGVVLYELLTGELPLGRFDLPSAKGKGNAKMDRVVLRALAKEPGQRYQHASDLKNELSGLGNWWDESPRRGKKGFEYRSKTHFLGLPLVHVVANAPTTDGRHKMARGWIAVGDVGAVGVVAVGGVYSVGVIAVGGVISAGGLLALGGAAAVGLVAAGGAVAAGLFAAGGAMAVGWFAISGAKAIGEHVLSGTVRTPNFGHELWSFVRGLWPF